METKNEFINFLISCNVLQFGNFVTKSGRHSPYFINTGNFTTGEQINRLSKFYADTIVGLNLKFDALFGPSYKGIPLVVSCCQNLYLCHKINVPFFFDRKEVKDHGEKGFFVGHKPKKDENIILVEDVLTAGTSVREVLDKFSKNLSINVKDMIVAVDRCEKISDSRCLSASKYLKTNLQIEVHPIVNIFDIKNYIQTNNMFSKYTKQMEAYIDLYCQN